MTLLIDPPDAAGHGRMWSHLASDVSFEELHAFAASLGIPRHGFDGDHYDIPAERYDSVVAAGAVPVASRDLVARLHAAGLRRRKGDSLGPRAAGQPLVRPRRLAPGDTVAVVAPAGPVPEDRLDRGIDVLRGWGLEVRELPHVRSCLEDVGYLAGSDAERAGDFMAAWCDESVAAVVCARGGYGVQRIVDRLDWEALARTGPKVLVGFSDITALHSAFASRLGLVTVHGPVVTSLGAGDDESREHLRRLLMDPASVTSLTTEPATPLVPGRAEGVLVGGNVALLAADLGTPTSRASAGSIAVLEDIGEELYRLDRLVTQLLRAGWFQGVQGIALGQFDECGTPDSVRRLFLDRLAPLGVPMLWDVPVGHGPRNLAVPFGVPAALDAGAGTLTLTRPALL